MYRAVRNDTCFRPFIRDNHEKQCSNYGSGKPLAALIRTGNPGLFHQFQSGKYSSALIGKFTWMPTWLSTFPSCT